MCYETCTGHPLLQKSDHTKETPSKSLCKVSTSLAPYILQGDKGKQRSVTGGSVSAEEEEWIFKQFD
jgi:hypothetical protein